MLVSTDRLLNANERFASMTWPRQCAGTLRMWFTCLVTGAQPCCGSGLLADLEPRHHCRTLGAGRIRNAKAPGCATCRSTTPPKIRSSSSSSPLPADPEARLRQPSGPPLGPPHDYVCACSPLPGRLVKGGRRLRLAHHWQWAELMTTAITRLLVHPTTIKVTTFHWSTRYDGRPRSGGAAGSNGAPVAFALVAEHLETRLAGIKKHRVN